MELKQIDKLIEKHVLRIGYRLDCDLPFDEMKVLLYSLVIESIQVYEMILTERMKGE